MKDGCDGEGKGRELVVRIRKVGVSGSGDWGHQRISSQEGVSRKS